MDREKAWSSINHSILSEYPLGASPLPAPGISGSRVRPVALYNIVFLPSVSWIELFVPADGIRGGRNQNKTTAKEFGPLPFY